MKNLLLLTTLWFLGTLPNVAQDKKAAEAEETAPAPVVQPPVVDPANVDQLRTYEQQVVIVRGKVRRTKDWDGGGNAAKAMNFVDLEGGHFVLVTFASDYDKFKPSRPAALYRDKTIEVTGKLEPHKGQWQIKLTSPDQVKVLEGDDKKAAKEEKKSKKDEADAAKPK